MKLQAPGKGQEEDYICCLLYVTGHVWCGSSDGTINVFNSQVIHLFHNSSYLQTGKCVTQLLGHTGSVNCLAFSPSTVWSGSGDRTIRAWDPETGKLVRMINAHSNWIRSIIVVDGKIWSASDDNFIRVWDENVSDFIGRGYNRG
jgi:WD40 repeat protein